MTTVRCKFGSIVQNAAEKLLPEWCNEETCPSRSACECFYTLRAHGVDPMKPGTITEGQT